MATKIPFVFGVLFGFILLSFVLIAINYSRMPISSSLQDVMEGPWASLKEENEENIKNELDGCLNVYLDMGSNIGVQVRKLFQPRLYPKAPILAVFNKYFGKDRNLNETCAVGWEGNKMHSEVLASIETAYQRCGWRTIFNKETGVGIKEGTLRFAAFDTLQVGKTLKKFPHQLLGFLVEDATVEKDQISDKSAHVDSVRVMRIAGYINDVVATRKIPSSTFRPPRVVMKLDVEGGIDLRIIIDMLLSGAFRHVDQLHLDWSDHAIVNNVFTSKKNREELKFLRESLNKIISIARREKMLQIPDIMNKDDESYGSGKHEPLPQC